MQSSLGPAWVGGAAKGALENGVAPAEGNPAGAAAGAAPKAGDPAAPFTGGNGELLAAPA
jgi:hypothetical protein